MALSGTERNRRYRLKHGYASDRKYQKNMTIKVSLTFYKNTDPKVIEKIQSVENKTDYIRQLILKDIGD